MHKSYVQLNITAGRLLCVVSIQTHAKQALALETNARKRCPRSLCRNVHKTANALLLFLCTKENVAVDIGVGIGFVFLGTKNSLQAKANAIMTIHGLRRVGPTAQHFVLGFSMSSFSWRICRTFFDNMVIKSFIYLLTVLFRPIIYWPRLLLRLAVIIAVRYIYDAALIRKRAHIEQFIHYW